MSVAPGGTAVVMRGGGSIPAPGADRRGAWWLIAGLCLTILVLHLLFRPSGGLRGRYAIGTPAGDGAVVHERIDRVIDFPVPQRLDAAYIFHWDIQRHGFPATMPPYDIRWEGLLLAPRAGRYEFAADLNGEAHLTLDGTTLALGDQPAAIDLTVGPHAIGLAYTIAQGEARLVLKWRPPEGWTETIPARNLAPDAAAPARGRARRAAGWILLAALGGGGVLGARLGRRGTGGAARLADTVRAHRGALALGAIALLALLLRLHDHALVPFHHETADEYQHAWEGWHLLHEGTPVSWTTFAGRYPAAAVREFSWFGDPYFLARPYFDHPPLFSVPVGLLAALAGADHFLECRLPVIRLVPIILSVLGVALVARLALVYGAAERAALCAALVYATLPVIVASHRLVKAESLLALLFMGVLILVGADGERAGGGRRIAGAAVLCGFSIWTKATGIAVPVVAALLLLRARRGRAALVVLGVSAGFLALYLLYAALYDWNVFVAVAGGQATSKWVSLEGLTDFLTGKVVSKSFGRGTYLWLLLALGLAAFRKQRALLVPVAIYAALLALTADHRVIYGWYRIPLYPFLCVAAGVYLHDMLEEGDLPRVFPFAASALASGLIYAFQAHPLALPPGGTLRGGQPVTAVQTQEAVAIFLLLALLPFLARWVRETTWNTRVTRVMAAILVVLFVAANVATVQDLLVIYSGTRGAP